MVWLDAAPAGCNGSIAGSLRFGCLLTRHHIFFFQLVDSKEVQSTGRDVVLQGLC
jgi:hypothetical protein